MGGTVLVQLGLSLCATGAPLTITGVTPRDGKVIMTWEGGTPPFRVLCRTNYTDEWRPIGQPTSGFSATNNAPPGAAMCFFKVTTDVTPPSVPTNLRLITNGCGTVLLTWSPAVDEANGSGLRGYAIYRNGAFINRVVAPVASSLQSGMSPASTYTFGVAAVDIAGNESAQATGTVTTVACANMRPVANAGPNQTNLFGTEVAFDGSASHDQDGSVTAYA